MKEILKVNSVSKVYGSFYALKDVNMCVNEGEIYGLVGKNGAGKSTLLKIITGLSYQTSGSIELLGDAGANINIARRRTGALINRPYFIPTLSARDNLEYIAINRDIKDRKKKVNETLELIGLENTKNKKAKNFSLGMQQRLAIGIALIDDPVFLILDEPINGLDPIGIKEIRDLIKLVNQERKTTVMISSHILSELNMVATKYGFIDNGRLIQEITKDELDEKLKSSTKIKVDDAAKATIVLEEDMKLHNYKVLADNVIAIYDNVSSSAIFKAFEAAGVEIIEINQVKDEFESYFLSLVGGRRDV